MQFKRSSPSDVINLLSIFYTFNKAKIGRYLCRNVLNPVSISWFQKKKKRKFPIRTFFIFKLSYVTLIEFFKVFLFFKRTKFQASTIIFNCTRSLELYLCHKCAVYLFNFIKAFFGRVEFGKSLFLELINRN